MRRHASEIKAPERAARARASIRGKKKKGNLASHRCLHGPRKKKIDAGEELSVVRRTGLSLTGGRGGVKIGMLLKDYYF